MRVTIVADDNVVLVNGVPQTVDCSALVAEGKQAVQWFDTVGEVEYRNEIDTETGAVTRKPNETITDFSPYQSYVDAWQAEADKDKIAPALNTMSTGNTTNQILGAT
jgi:hypothetical protein